MNDTLAILFTFTTYGTWLRGDERGWIEDGRLMPPDPVLERDDRDRMKGELFLFCKADLHCVGAAIGESLIERKDALIYALTVQTWHIHFVIASARHPVADIAKCAKDAVRWRLRPERRIWTKHYDKRFCFDNATVRDRIAYVERHNERIGWPAKPWPFIKTFTPLEQDPES